MPNSKCPKQPSLNQLYIHCTTQLQQSSVISAYDFEKTYRLSKSQVEAEERGNEHHDCYLSASASNFSLDLDHKQQS